MSLRLLVLNWRDIRSPEAGGAEVHLHEVFRRLVERGHEVTLVCGQFVSGRGEPEERVDGIRTLRVGRWWNAHLSVPRIARRLLQDERFDVVVDDVNKIPFLAPRFSPVPVVGLFLHLLGKSLFLEASPAVATVLWLLERRVGRVYRTVPKVAISNGTAEELQALGCPEETISIIEPGLDHDVFRPGVLAKTPHPSFVVVSRLKRYKRVDVALRAFARIRRTLPTATLEVLGDGNRRPALERLAERLDVSVTFLGHVPEPEKVSRLNAAWLALNPSLKEGWGLAGMEAMACGTPVVASDVPGHRDSVPEGAGSLVPYGDPDAMAQEALRLVADRGLYEAFRRGGIAWARKFTWDAAAAAFERVLTDAAGRSVGRRSPGKELAR